MLDLIVEINVNIPADLKLDSLTESARTAIESARSKVAPGSVIPALINLAGVSLIPYAAIVAANQAELQRLEHSRAAQRKLEQQPEPLSDEYINTLQRFYLSASDAQKAADKLMQLSHE